MNYHVLVLGGTGFLGAPIARALAEAGHSVRVLARNRDKATALLGDQVEIRVGDVTDSAAIQRVMDGCNAVHISLAYGIEKPAVEAVLSHEQASELERIIYISGTTVCEENRWFDLVDEKLCCEEAITASGIPYTIFRPSWFIEMLENFVKGKRALLIGRHPHPYHWMTRDDFVRIVVDSYRLEEAQNRTFTIHGQEVMHLRDALLKYIDRMHPEVHHLTPFPPPLAWLIATLTGNDRLKLAARMMRYFSRVGEPGDPTEANALFGPPATTFDAWLAENRNLAGA